MTTFDNREKAFEKKFAYDEEVTFKATVRRNKIVAAWAAQLMGYTEAQAEAYSKEVVAADFEAAGDDDVIKKILNDFATAGITTTEADIRVKMNEAYSQALAAITS